jgi:hypothetical protein
MNLFKRLALLLNKRLQDIKTALQDVDVDPREGETCADDGERPREILDDYFGDEAIRDYIESGDYDRDNS